MIETDEIRRLAALRKYRILDTEPEQAFDDLTQLASQICGTPIAAISLVDEDRQWFKSRVGLSVTETSRSIAICSHAIEQRDLLVVPDTAQDEKFRDNPVVCCAPAIRFYAGAPLITPEGETLGTLCVMDNVPRQLTQEQREALEALRRQAQSQLQLRLHLMELQEALADRDRAEEQQKTLIGELREALDQVEKLSALLPLCSACQFNMVIPADPQRVPTVTDGVVRMLTDKGWPEQRIMEVELALQEALTNAIRHGCQNDPTRNVQCVVTCEDGGGVMLVVRDPGQGFEAATVANPLAPENVLKPGGRGIFLINNLMDEVAFRDGGREVLMKKNRD